MNNNSKKGKYKVHSSIERHLGWIWFLATKNKVTINLSIQAFYLIFENPYQRTRFVLVFFIAFGGRGMEREPSMQEMSIDWLPPVHKLTGDHMQQDLGFNLQPRYVS